MYEGRIAPRSLLYLLNGDDTENIGLHDAQIRLFSLPNRVKSSVWTNFNLKNKTKQNYVY